MEKKEGKIETVEPTTTEAPAEETFKAPDPKAPAADGPKEVAGEENKHKEHAHVHGHDCGHDHSHDHGHEHGHSHGGPPKGLPPKYFPRSF